MCFHPARYAPPVPVYTPILPPHSHYHLVETVTITIQIDLDITT